MSIGTDRCYPKCSKCATSILLRSCYATDHGVLCENCYVDTERHPVSAYRMQLPNGIWVRKGFSGDIHVARKIRGPWEEIHGVGL